MKRVPLLATGSLTALLLLGPAMALWLLPRPQARGLERLLPQASLLQSFPAAPTRPVPQLWQQRLGPRLAERLWREQRGVWWQFWGRDGDGGPFLALVRPAEARGPALPVAALPVDELVVLPPDPLSRRLLADQLRSTSRQQRHGLEHRCMERLQQGQAVYWSPIGLAQLTGAMAPLLQMARQGCLSLAPSGARLLNGLDLTGEAAARAGVLGNPPTSTVAGQPPLLPVGTLLDLSGPALAPVFESLLARQLIRDPLASRYGLAESQLKLLTGVPFRLRLRPIAQGPFQAGLELQLAVGRERKPWAALLRDLRQGLLRQNLQEAPAEITAATPGLRSQSLPSARFVRDDGTVVGGWRWQSVGGGEPQLLLFLGPVPQGLAAPVPAQPSTAPLSLQLQPAGLSRLGLMPQGLPQLVRQARLLQLSLSPSDQPLSRLTGRLHLSVVR